jgi:peptidylprolyl isomerase
VKVKPIALVGACLALSVSACGGTGSGAATGAGEAEGTVEHRHLLPRGPTVRMSKAEIAKLPPLTMPRPSGSPPRRLVVVDLRKGSGPGVPKHDWVTNREEVFIRYSQASYPKARRGHSDGPFGPNRVFLEDSIKGLAVGLTGMKVGGRRELIVPPKLVYPRWKPSWGYAPFVTVFAVDLVGMEPPPDRRVEYRNRPFGHSG